MNDNKNVCENEKMINVPVLFDLEETEKILSRIESFNPKSHLRKIESENGTSYYLDTKYRIVWFRNVFPFGKVHKILKELTEDSATFEVRVYVDRNDSSENFIANGFATRRKDETNAEFGMNFIESAETAALGRALKDAGFGTQSCGMDIEDLESDPQMVDAGVPVSANKSDSDKSEKATIPSTKASAKKEENNSESKVVEEPKCVKLTKDMEVEELVKQMSADYAEKIVVDYGADAGKTLGYLNKSKPGSMEYHASCSKNNLIKAGAIVLIADKKKSE